MGMYEPYIDKNSLYNISRNTFELVLTTLPVFGDQVRTRSYKKKNECYIAYK